MWWPTMNPYFLLTNIAPLGVSYTGGSANCTLRETVLVTRANTSTYHLSVMVAMLGCTSLALWTSLSYGR